MADPAFLLLLSRAQFGLTASFHYLFVPLTLGLALAMAVLESAGAWRADPAWARAARFFNRFFVLGWLAGIATGYPLRMQLQERWSGYGEQVSQVLSAVMGVEGVIGPLMLVLVLVLALAPGSLPLAARVAARWLLLGVMLVQSVCILSMNAWMQHPVGTRWEGGQAVLLSLADVLLNPVAVHKVSHTLSAAALTGACFMLVLSVLGLRRGGPDRAVFKAALSVALAQAVVALLATLATGHESVRGVMQHQPVKFAAMEAHWAREGSSAPLVVMALPDDAGMRNRFALEIPGLMSWLSGVDEAPPGLQELSLQAEAHIRASLMPGASPALNGWRQLYEVTARRAEDWSVLSGPARIERAVQASRPHVPTLFFAFRVMVGCGVAMALVLAWAVHHRAALVEGRAPRLSRALVYCVSLPWVASLAGWMVAEVGRQPWSVYERVATGASVALPSASRVTSEFTGFFLLYAGMGLLLCVVARRLWLAGPTGAVWAWPKAGRALPGQGVAVGWAASALNH